MFVVNAGLGCLVCLSFWACFCVSGGGFNLCGLLPCVGLLATCVWCCLFCLFGVGLLAVCFV